MSDTTASAQHLPGAEGYRLSDDLARLCLPSEFRDSYRALAWVDSICFLFLLIGLIGLRPPKILEKPVIGPPEAVPAIFTPPEEQPKTEPIVQQEQPQQEQQETIVETPPIPTVVAAKIGRASCRERGEIRDE